MPTRSFDLGLSKFESSPFHSIFMVRPDRGSFAVQFRDHFRSGDHLRACRSYKIKKQLSCSQSALTMTGCFVIGKHEKALVVADYLNFSGLCYCKR